MNHRVLKIWLLLTAMSMVTAAGAQLNADGGPETGNRGGAVGVVNLSDSMAVYRALYDNTPIEPVFKLTPRFAVVGLDNRFVFSMGASLKFTASMDWNNPVRNPAGLSPGAVEHSGKQGKRLYQMSAGGSGIYFNIIGFPNTDKETGLFISIAMDNESNNSYKLAASQVYMRYRDLQMGYATSLYNDRRADAFTIDGAGPCASGAYSTVGINWQHYFNSHIHLGVGVELPEAAYTQINPSALDMLQGAQRFSSNTNQYVPNFPFYIGYIWGDNNHVRLSGIVKDVHYVDLATGSGHDQPGMGIKVTGHVVTSPFEWSWMAQYGYASASTFKGDKGEGLDLVPDQNRLGRLKPTQTWGFIAAAQWNITSKCFATLQYSYLRNIVPYYSIAAETAYEDQTRNGSTFTANGVWKISSLFSTGIEYRHVRKATIGGDKVSDNRVYMMFMMNF